MGQVRSRPTKPEKKDNNKILPEDRPVHEWYRFVLSFPPHLVREYLDCFQVQPADVVLDPFCGTGTTIVECKKRGISGIGIEASRLEFYQELHTVYQAIQEWSLVRVEERSRLRQINEPGLVYFP